MDIARLKAAIETSFEADYPKLDSLHKDLHAHPELAFEEVKTAAKLAAEMRALGFEVTEKVGRTGLVAIYGNGDGPTIMVRTELDALPMEEKTDPLCQSRQDRMERSRDVCGTQLRPRHPHGQLGRHGEDADWTEGPVARHADVHRATGRRNRGGARAMLADGLFTRFKKPDFAFALHAGGGPYGHVSYRVGVGSSHVDGLYIKFRGRGGHGATPQRTIDPVMMAARFIVDVQSVISREKDPPNSASSASVPSIPAPPATSFPTMQWSWARSARSSRRCAPMLAGIERTAKAVAAMSDAPAPDISLSEGTKAVINDPGVVATRRKR